MFHRPLLATPLTPRALATIPEDSKHADTTNAKEMDANDEETTENSSNHAKSHILITTANSPRNDNSSVGSTSAVTKSEVASSQTKFANTLRQISSNFNRV